MNNSNQNIAELLYIASVRGYLALCGAPPLHLTSPAAGSDLGLKTWKAAAPSSILPSSFFPAHFANYRYGFVEGRSPPPLPSPTLSASVKDGWIGTGISWVCTQCFKCTNYRLKITSIFSSSLMSPMPNCKAYERAINCFEMHEFFMPFNLKSSQ